MDYASGPEAAAIQWLEPSQTTGGRHPFLLTQSETVYARSWIPCQDTPSNRVTSSATVRVPPGLTALMSAVNPTEPTEDGESLALSHNIGGHPTACGITILGMR